MRMSRYFMVLTASAAVAVGSTAQAATILFNPAGTGAGGALTIDLLDPGPGNSLSQGLSSSSAVGTVGTLLFQANLGTADNTIAGVETQIYTNGGSGHSFTFAASFSEKVTANTGGSNPILAFGPTSGSGSAGTFNIYAQTGAGSDLSGTCFVNCGGNPAILTGSILNNTDFSGGFFANTANPVQALDQFGANNYPTVNTITGNGSFTADILVTSANTNFFPGLTPGTVLIFATSENVLPFKQANPSACFSSDAVTSCNVAGAGGAGVGSINGLGTSTILQTDANLSFGPVPPVPEPATLSLLGLGLMAGAGQLRKRFARK